MTRQIPGAEQASGSSMDILKEMPLPVATPILDGFISLGLKPELFRSDLGGSGSALGRCPAGGYHDHQGSRAYTLAVNDAAFKGQSDWRWCRKCQGLSFAGFASAGQCSAGGLHDHEGSGDYALVVNDGAAPGERDWRWCLKCQGLSRPGESSPGACPAGGMHDHQDSGNYCLAVDNPSAPGQTNWKCCNKCLGLSFAPVDAPPLHPQLFLVETYRMTSFRTAIGKGPQVGIVNLGPGQQTSIKTTMSLGSNHTSVDTTTVMESQDQAVTQSFNAHVANASTKDSSVDSQTYRMDGHAHGSAGIGVGSTDVDATVHVEGGGNQTRNSTSDACESAADSQIARTDATRNQRIEAGTQSSSTDLKTTTESFSIQNNPNPNRTLMIRYFQAIEEYTSFVCLVNVEVAFRTANPKAAPDRQVPLNSLDNLLREVLEPAQVVRVRDRIKRTLQIVTDFEDQPTAVVEEKPIAEGETMLRFKKKLTSTYSLKDANGVAVRDISVDGLLLRAFQRRIRSREVVSDLTVGEFNAV